MRATRLVCAVAMALCLPPQTVHGQQPAVSNLTPQEVILRPGDALVISVWPDPTLGGQFAIEETGFVYLPYLGQVRAAGVPIQELRDRLRTGYAGAIQNPVVSVTPLFNVGVLGEVRVPGNYPANPTNTFFDMIGMAGGFTTASDLEKVRLIRGGQVTELDALRQIEEGVGLEAFSLQSGDQIVVPARGGIPWGVLVTVVQTALTIVLLLDRINRN